MVWMYTGTPADDYVAPPPAQVSYYIDGGAGVDTVFTGVSVNSAVFTYSQNKVTGVTTLTAASTGALTMQLHNVEKVLFTDYTWNVPPAADTTPPTATTFNPASGATGVSITSNIVVTFSEAIQMGTGSIVLKDAIGNVIETFDAATSNRLSISGADLTIKPSSALAGLTQYFVTFAPGTIKDISGNAYAGTTAYSFTTAADTTPPVAVTFNPASGSVSADIPANIIVTFSKAIKRGMGSIVLQSAGGSIIETYDAATSNRLTIAGADLTITPTSALSYSTQYLVTFAPGTVTDISGNAYAGTTAYNFTTLAPGQAALVAGWNLLGNGVNTQLTVATTFSDATKYSTIWKWVPATSKWAFYTPTQTDGGAAYAASKGYDFLTTINGGEGFWVNAKAALTTQLPTGTAIASSAFIDQAAPLSNNLPSGWSLIAVGDKPSTRSFVNAIALSPPVSPAVAATSLTTLWAWDGASSKWSFYAPSLDNNGTLTSYTSSKGYLNFGSKAISPTTGLWVNHP